MNDGMFCIHGTPVEDHCSTCEARLSVKSKAADPWQDLPSDCAPPDPALHKIDYTPPAYSFAASGSMDLKCSHGVSAYVECAKCNANMDAMREMQVGWRPPTPAPERVNILQEGAALTFGPRDAEYGPPQINLACAGELKQLARKHARRDISPAEWEAIDMVLTKLGRVLVAKPKRDTYVDGATYFAIAGEIALTS